MMITKVGRQLVFGAVLLGPLALGTAAHAAGTPAQRCQAGKAKTTGKYAACRQNAEAKLATTGDIPKYTDALDKCATKFSIAWQKLEDKAAAAGAVCPADETVVKDKTDAYTDSVAALGAGTRFTDNSDGTVTDHQTGLQWEKKGSPDGIAFFPNPHDVDNVYTWSGLFSYLPDGQIVTEFLDRLNGNLDNNPCISVDGTTVTGGFAGHCDWRLPTIVELAGIADCGIGSPCIDQTVFGSTKSSAYWSATTWATDWDYAAYVSFTTGVLGFEGKNLNRAVRAVRGGS